jgi:hypothetical protein
MNCPAQKVERPAPAPPVLEHGDAPATEPARQKRIEINKKNKAFWDKQEPPPPPPDPLAIIRAEVMRALARESAREAVKASDAARRANDAALRAKGARESAKVRGDKNTYRNRNIHNAHAAGMKVKQIAGNPKIRGKKVSESQIRRILKAPRP